MGNGGLSPNNPFTLFLILILLVLSTKPEAEQHLTQLAAFIQATQHSVQVFRSGLETFYAAAKNL
ncbi:hypothetical protein [Desulfovirgula thermocuniculi]|uniref:hypothetical protein n=1 Tax=Desulfovirgula thermocuniculi TaxID=348842 RepID=UPI0003F5CC41|nr:hypothetical protein [Desulfovirgula thermocuniculi]